MLGGWRERGEKELGGASGQGYLQGVDVSDVSPARLTVATQRRVVMLDEARQGWRALAVPRRVCFEVEWSRVLGYWTGVMSLPPELWRSGSEAEVTVLTLDPAAAAGRDLVIVAATGAWVTASRAMGVVAVPD